MNSQFDLKLLYPYIRVINASPEKNLDFYMFNSKIFPNAYPGDNSQYLKCERGPTTFKITHKDSNDSIASMGINLEIGKVYDICTVGEKNNVSLFAIENYVTKNNLEYGHLRICNLSKPLSGCNIYADGVCFAADFDYLDVSEYIEMLPREYEFEIRNNGGESIKNTGTFKIKAGKYNSLYIINPENEKDEPCHIFTVDAGSYSGFYL